MTRPIAGVKGKNVVSDAVPPSLAAPTWHKGVLLLHLWPSQEQRKIIRKFSDASGKKRAAG
jgi:hypothetical protein